MRTKMVSIHLDSFL